MEPVNHLNLIAKDLVHRRIKWLGHIQDHRLDSLKFGLRAAGEPGHRVRNPPACKRGDRSTVVQVHDDRIVAMALTPGVFINAQGPTQLAWPSTMALFKCPAKHRACR